jgi:HK97 family phage portal protein
MGWFSRRKTQTAEPTAPAEARGSEVIEAMRRPTGSFAGQTVTLDKSQHLMPIWRCQMMIADIVAGLPIQQFRNRNGRTVETDRSPFVDDPSVYLDAVEWRTALLLSTLGHGNGLAVTTEVDTSGWPRRAEVVSWDDVRVSQPNGALSPPLYAVSRKIVDPDRVMHLRAFGPKPGTAVGMSPIAYARETIGLSLAVRDFGAQWYASGGHPTTLLTTEEEIDDKQATDAKESFRAATRGDHLAVMGNGWDLKSVQVAPDDALFLAATNATAVDMCGYYGIPPELLGYAPSGQGSITYANREQRAIDLLVFTLQWWVGRMERLVSRQLPGGQHVRINIDGFLRSDAATRWGIHKSAVQLGVRSRNEIRDLEDESPLPEPTGDEYLWPPQFGAASQPTTTTTGGGV